MTRSARLWRPKLEQTKLKGANDNYNQGSLILPHGISSRKNLTKNHLYPFLIKLKIAAFSLSRKEV